MENQINVPSRIQAMEEIYNAVGDDITIQKIFSCKEKIKELANTCRNAQLFKNVVKKAQQMLDVFFQNHTKEERITVAWNHLDYKLATSRTSLHFEAVIILCVPILDDILNDKNEITIN